MDEVDAIAVPRIDPRIPFERTAAFRQYGARLDPDPDAPEDLYTKMIIQEQGFDGLPLVVFRAQMDRYVADGEMEAYRGVVAVRYAEQVRSGDFFVGRGGFGSGMYTVAGDIGLAIAREFAGDRNGAVLRLSLKYGARIVNAADIRRRADEERVSALDRLRDEMSRAIRAAFGRGGRREANRVEAAYDERVAGVVAKCSDVGRYAAFLGYDATFVPDESYFVVLNRTAVRVQRENVAW